jgi:hypothetical protein
MPKPSKKRSAIPPRAIRPYNRSSAWRMASPERLTRLNGEAVARQLVGDIPGIVGSVVPGRITVGIVGVADDQRYPGRAVGGEGGGIGCGRQNACQQQCTNEPHKLPARTQKLAGRTSAGIDNSIANGPRLRSGNGPRPRLRHHLLALWGARLRARSAIAGSFPLLGTDQRFHAPQRAERTLFQRSYAIST